ncbi:MAG TPA: hypothetical protein VI583_03860 [Cyclobacteriaceae bacterium]|nr:hypothetical protein [Cyclobacteriaceae bacterium]
MRKFQSLLLLALVLSIVNSVAQSGSHYKNFRVSVYARAYEVRQMADKKWLDSAWHVISSQVKVDKIYLETHRDLIVVDEKILNGAKKYFEDRGIETAGGITYTISERNRFQTYCYSNPEYRQKAREVAEYTAKHFDEMILDDFFFTDCKCEFCIREKGERSWTDFRLQQMRDAGNDLIIGPAKAVNPNVKIVIKYPNWYEHFQGLGFDLKAGPEQYDGIYTGTETRDPDAGGQHLQQYESYLVFRYFENLKPGNNGGGWVDTGGMRYIDRYTEQLWLTLIAKAPEITLFDFRQLQRPILTTDRAEWQGTGTSFDFDEIMEPFKSAGGKMVTPSTMARAAGYTVEMADAIVGLLGSPVGVKTYKPFHSTGEDFLQNYMGMEGIPMDIVPEFPAEPSMILLTETAAFDKDIVIKIRARLEAGKNVTITSGLLYALEGKGIEDIVELQYTQRKALVNEFQLGRGIVVKSEKDILIPQIQYLTNDSWEDITSLDGAAGWPILHQARYGNGSLFVLTIPDNFADLYQYPQEVLGRIREVLSQDMKVYFEGPSKVSLFLYDNNTLIAESFLPETSDVKICVKGENVRLTELPSGLKIDGQAGEGNYIWGREREKVTTFEITIKPHSFKVFRIN